MRPFQGQQYVYYQPIANTYEVVPASTTVLPATTTYEYVQFASVPPPPPPPHPTKTYELIQLVPSPSPPPTTTVIEIQNTQDIDFLKFNLAQANLEVKTWKKQARKLEDLMAHVNYF